VSEVRRSMPVIIIKIENEKGKKEIMRKKFKFKDDRMYIKNDLQGNKNSGKNKQMSKGGKKQRKEDEDR